MSATATKNRIRTTIELIQERLDGLTEAEVQKLDAEMDVSFEEFFAFQQAQAYAHVSGKITTEEAQIVYAALGEVGSADNGGWAEGTNTATKVAVTKVVSELIAARVEGR